MTAPSERLLTLPDVRLRVGLGTAMIYRLIAQGRFPKPGKFGRRSLWVASEIDKWVADRIALRNMGRNMGDDLAA